MYEHGGTFVNVSIVTPSYQQGRFIQRTLQSVADQQAPGVEIEHVVFDGGSTDNTVDIVKHFHPPVRWISQKDEGQADAVNRGICDTNGRIIGWLNSDDIYSPGAIAGVVDYFSAHPEVDVVYGMADHIDEKDRAFESYPTEPWDFQRLRETCFICQPAAFFRRRVVERHGLLDKTLNYCMDYEYWLRLGKAGRRFAYFEQKLAGSRLYADNKTLGARVKVHREINDMFKKMFGSVPDQWLINYAHAVTAQNIDRSQSSRFYAINCLALVIYSAWHWNRRVPSKMMLASLARRQWSSLVRKAVMP